MVPQGIQQFVTIAPKYFRKGGAEEAVPHTSQSDFGFSDEVLVIHEDDLEGIYLKSLGVEILQQNEDGRRHELEEKEGSMTITVDRSGELLDPGIAEKIAEGVKNEPLKSPAAAPTENVKDILKKQEIIRPAPQIADSSEFNASQLPEKATPSLTQRQSKELKKPLSKNKPTSVSGFSTN